MMPGSWGLGDWGPDTVICFHSHAAFHCEATSMTAYTVALSEGHGEAERDWGSLGPHI